MEHLKIVPALKKKDLFLTLLPAVFWLILFQARPYVLSPACVEDPAICRMNHVSRMDRVSVRLHHPEASFYSNVTQTSIAVAAFSVPLLFQATGVALFGLNPITAITFFATDLVIGVQTAVWNGFVNELVKVVVQRPRPFVYRNVEHAGPNPAHYTSFYSGHTSFAAAVSMFLIITLFARSASPMLLICVSGLGFSLTSMTAFFRVLAGVHFISDVIIGALAGSVIAVVVAYTHREERVESLETV